MAVKAVSNAGIYDWADAEEEGDPLVAGESGLERVASHLRDVILNRDHDQHVAPGKALPGQLKLAGELGIDPAIVNRAYSVIAAEGLARKSGQGKAYSVPRRRPYQVTATITPRKAEADTDGVYEAIVDAKRTDPLIGPVVVNVLPAGTVVVLTVEMPDAAWAVTRGAAAIRTAIGESWDILDVSAAEA